MTIIHIILETRRGERTSTIHTNIIITVMYRDIGDNSNVVCDCSNFVCDFTGSQIIERTRDGMVDCVAVVYMQEFSSTYTVDLIETYNSSESTNKKHS